MAIRESWHGQQDETIYDKRDASLLLDRNRRDSLARIRDESIESFSYLYNMEYGRANEMEERLREERGLEPLPRGDRIADHLIEWGIDILGLSPAGSGWRANQVENVLKSRHRDGLDDDTGMETKGRGLRHRE